MNDPELPSRAESGWLGPALASVGHLLPAQAPLEVFVHHNTLHAFEHLPFHEAVQRASEATGARGYLEERQYLAAFAGGRITDDDIIAAIRAELGVTPSALPNSLPTAHDLARLVLVHGVHAETPAGVLWQLDEHGAATSFVAGVAPTSKARVVDETWQWLRAAADARPLEEALALVTGPGDARTIATTFEERFGRPATDAGLRALLAAPRESIAVAALWEASRGVSALAPRSRRAPAAPAAPPCPILPRDAVLRVGGDDPDDLVHPILVGLAGAFLDRGQSQWSMPDREHGFFVAFRRVLAAGHALRPAWLRDLGDQLRLWEASGETAESAIKSFCDELGIEPHERESFLRSTVLRLPGWAGMFHRLESSAPAAGRSAPSVSLVDFVAVRLCLDVLALTEVASRLGHHGELNELRAFAAELPPVAAALRSGEHDRAWPLFVVAQHAGVAAPSLLALSPAEIDALVELLHALDGPTRMRIWHEAYERHYREQLLTGLAARAKSPAPPASPRFQVFFCIDDREESLRRHFEELAPEHVTYGVPGFFNLAIAYQGIDDPSTFPLCPVVLTPQHKVAEEVLSEHAPVAAARRRRLQSLTNVSIKIERAQNSVVWGAIVTAVVGFIATLPLLAVVFAPWVAGRVRKKVASLVLPAPRTRLSGARATVDETATITVGFAVEEKAERVATLLENAGLTSGFASLVVLLGHDASSANNPHFAAYSCGACGGRSGGPNARLFAHMANKPEVRAALRARGIDIPDTTWFLGGEHDTCADTVRLFDTDEVPVRLAAELERLQTLLDRALADNSQERCRKFASASATIAPEAARRHVEARSFDLSQARPELGHATNAACVVGRRALSRDLFLDRRAFLVSYDPTSDPEGRILERILLAVGPVCSGINLEYLFSAVDDERWGAGTKLPHNVTGLFGVMNGASSDLRTGLPRQMVEVHEPIRLQLVVEATPAVLEAVLDRAPTIGELCRNQWVHLIAIDPDTGAVTIFSPRSGFEPWSPRHSRVAEVARSADWYRGHHGLLAPALVARDIAPFEESGGVV